MAVRLFGYRHWLDYNDPADPRIGYTLCGARFVWDNQHAIGEPKGLCKNCLELKQKPDEPGSPSGI